MLVWSYDHLTRMVHPSSLGDICMKWTSSCNITPVLRGCSDPYPCQTNRIDRTVGVAIWSNLIHGSTISRITDHERRGKICCSVMTCITQAFLHTRCPCLMFYLNAVFGWKKLNCWLHIIWRKYRQHIVLFKFLLITMRVFRTSWRVTFETPPGPAPWTASGRLPFPGAYVMTLQ